jgi:lambda repressor-like predicted transcriptional regulator
MPKGSLSLVDKYRIVALQKGSSATSLAKRYGVSREDIEQVLKDKDVIICEISRIVARAIEAGVQAARDRYPEANASEIAELVAAAIMADDGDDEEDEHEG